MGLLRKSAEERGSLRVLVAEDHVVNQQAFQFILQSFGVQPVLVGDGAEALRAAQTETYDLIFMDMQMPVMDGLAATRAIRGWEQGAGRPRTPIAMLTANTHHDHVDAALEAGCDLHLAKPITPAGLLQGMNRALGLASAPPAASPEI